MLPSLLQAMLGDMRKADPLYQPTNYWRVCSGEILRDIEKYGAENFKRHPSAVAYYLPTYASIHIKEKAWLLSLLKMIGRIPKAELFTIPLLEEFDGAKRALRDYQVFKSLDRLDAEPTLSTFSESAIGQSADRYIFDDHAYSFASLNYLRGLVFLKRCVDTSKIRTVLEIGGGYGELGEILSSYRYFNVDIPPVAYISTWYLQQVLGEANVFSYDRSGPMNRIELAEIKEQSAVFCPWQLPHLSGSIDLFVNYISFQEMEPAVVRNYAAHIERLRPRFLLLRNRRQGEFKVATGRLGVQEPIRSDAYLGYFPAYRLVAEDSALFGSQNLKRVSGCHYKLNFESVVQVFERQVFERR